MNAQVVLSTHGHWRRLATALAVVVGLVGHGAADAATIFVTSLADKINDHGGCSLKEAILSANGDTNFIFTSPTTGFFTGCVAGSGDDTIVLPAGQVILLNRIFDELANPFGPTATPMITSTIKIEMNGTRLQWIGAQRARAFAVASTGDLTLRNAYIKDFVAKGGDGSAGGGGGMGAGGAVYVKGSGRLAIDSCTFEHNGAFGGQGSPGGTAGSGGGGGGLGGNGGGGGNTHGGGGGGGSRGSGGTGVNSQGGGGGGTLTAGGDFTGGVNCGGAGGSKDVVFFGGQNGQDGFCPGGGGGGGVGNEGGPGSTSGTGGEGAYGGGGGGGGYPGTGGSDGGRGDFGGGGGAAGGDVSNLDGVGPSGGSGGFGGGGGSGEGGFLHIGGPGKGGLLAGDASRHGGGGGAALGGAIFSDGGTLAIINSTFTRNFVVSGVRGDSEAGDGAGEGGAIFSLNGTTSIESSTITINNTSTFGGGIAALQFGAGPPEAVFTLHNTIVYDNGGLACGVAISTATVFGSNNIIQDNAGCPGELTSADPLLGPLQLNDGLTPTMAITDASPAFDAGGVPPPSEHTDQRGARRPQGSGFDIGAYELCVFDPKESCFGFLSFEFTQHLDTSALPAVGGTVTPPSGDYPFDSVQPLKAAPNAGFSFLNWTGNVADPTSASTFVVMDQDQVVTANFAGCAINVSARGTAGNAISPPRVDLTWVPNGADHANVFRGATTGGPYAFVGTATTTSFTDTTPGLVNNTKAYYVLEFFASTGVKMCDSSEVSVAIPRGR